MLYVASNETICYSDALNREVDIMLEKHNSGVIGFLNQVKASKQHRKNALERVGFDSSNDLEIDQHIRSEKVSVLVLKNLKAELEISEEDTLALVGMSRATMARRETLKADEAGRVFRVVSLLDLSEKVLGGHDKGVRWLKSPAYFLGNETPLNLAKTEAGADAVKNLLFRIEYSVYS